MSVSLDEVRRIAKLARLKFSAEEEVALVEDLGVILEYMALLQDVPEIDSPTMTSGDFRVSFREDIAAAGSDRSKALSSGSRSHPDYFEVPKVIRKQRPDG